MRKTMFLLMIALLLLPGCGGKGPRTAVLVDYGQRGTVSEEAEIRPVGGYLSGHWGEKFVRSNGSTIPLELDAPVSGCGGFTLEYEILEVQRGNFSGNFRYEVYVRTTEGKWKSVTLFQMQGMEQTVEVLLETPVDIEAVAVVCGKKEKPEFTHDIRIRDVQ